MVPIVVVVFIQVVCVVTAQTARHHYDTSSIRKGECGPYCSCGFHYRLCVVTAQTVRHCYDTSSIRKGVCGPYCRCGFHSSCV